MGDRDARRHPTLRAIARKPAIQRDRAGAQARARWHRVRRAARARWPTWEVEDDRAGAQRGLAAQRVQELRGLRRDSGVRSWPRDAATACCDVDVRDHVCRGPVVEMPPPDRRRLRDGARSTRVPHLHADEGRTCEADALRAARSQDAHAALSSTYVHSGIEGTRIDSIAGRSNPKWVATSSRSARRSGSW